VSFLICGVACIVALLVNGASMVIGPRVRAWAAVARAILWLQFGISTLQAGIEQGYPYTVQPFWFTFALAEVWVAYRAVLDVRSSSLRHSRRWSVADRPVRRRRAHLLRRAARHEPRREGPQGQRQR
jgi:hypothetical protein